jgi:hypothetical protein
MTGVALILLLMVSAAHAADTRSPKCRLLPHLESCKPPAPAQPPAAPAEPVQAPAVTPPPVLAPAVPSSQASPEPLQAPLPTIAPVQPPATPAPPAAAPAPPRAAPARAAPVKKAKPAETKKREARPKRAVPPAKAKRARIGNWCDRIPKGTTMSTVEFWAPTFGVKMTPRNRALAQACLDSK